MSRISNIPPEAVRGERRSPASYVGGVVAGFTIGALVGTAIAMKRDREKTDMIPVPLPEPDTPSRPITMEELITAQLEALKHNSFRPGRDITPEYAAQFMYIMDSLQMARERFELAYGMRDDLHAVTLYDTYDLETIPGELQEIERLLREQKFIYESSQEEPRIITTDVDANPNSVLGFNTIPLIVITSLANGDPLPDDIKEICIDMRRTFEIHDVHQLLRKRKYAENIDGKARDKIMNALDDPSNDSATIRHISLYLHIRRHDETDD